MQSKFISAGALSISSVVTNQSIWWARCCWMASSVLCFLVLFGNNGRSLWYSRSNSIDILFVFLLETIERCVNILCSLFRQINSCLVSLSRLWRQRWWKQRWWRRILRKKSTKSLEYHRERRLSMDATSEKRKKMEKGGNPETKTPEGLNTTTPLIIFPIDSGCIFMAVVLETTVLKSKNRHFYCVDTLLLNRTRLKARSRCYWHWWHVTQVSGTMKQSILLVSWTT